MTLSRHPEHKPLTATQRKALNLAKNKGGAQLGTAKGQVKRQVANVLLSRGWVTIIERTVLITKSGRAKVAEPIPEERPVFLRHRDGLTNRPDLAVRDEPEVTDPATLKSFWAAQAEARREGAQESRQRAKGIPRALREAA